MPTTDHERQHDAGGEVGPSSTAAGRLPSSVVAELGATNAADLLRAAALARPATTIDDGRTVVTFAELVASADHVARQLVETYGVRLGDRIGLTTGNRIEWITTFIAAISAGATVLAVPTGWPAEFADRVYERERPVLTIADGRGLDTLARSCRRFGSRVISVDDAEVVRGAEVHQWREVTDLRSTTSIDGPPEVARAAANPNAAADALVTFGTGAGGPRGWIFTNGALAAAARRAATHRRQRWSAIGDEADPTSPLLVLEPLWHWIGLSGLLGGIAGSHPLILADGDDDDAVSAAIRRDGIGEVVAMPLRLGRRLDADPGPAFGSVRMIGLVGDRATTTTIRLLRRRAPGAALWAGYGLAEINGVVASAPVAADREGRQWLTTFERDTIELRDGDGVPVAPGEAGDAWVRTDAVADRSWPEELPTAEPFDGWIHTGDVVLQTSDGLAVLGRPAEAICSGATTVYSGDVEHALDAGGWVAESAVVRVPSATGGSDVVAVVRPNDAAAGRLTHAVVLRTLEHTLPPEAWPVRTLATSELLPTAPPARLDRAAVRRLVRPVTPTPAVVRSLGRAWTTWLAAGVAGLVIGAGLVAVTQDSSRTAPFPPLPTAPPPATVVDDPALRYPIVFEDRFDRPDADRLGGPRNGRPWANASGVFVRRDGHAIVGALPSGTRRDVAVTQLGSPFRDLRVTLPIVRSGAGILFRADDAANGFVLTADPDDGTWNLIKLNGGEATSIRSFPDEVIDGGTQLRIVNDDEGFVVVIDDQIAGRVDDVDFGDGRTIGLVVDDRRAAYARWDDVIVRAASTDEGFSEADPAGS